MRLIVVLVLALSTSVAVLAQQRFDFKVREDMFAGMDGDTAAFDRAMKLIDDTLATDPNHAEALVWRGDGRLFLAGQAFQRGAFADGQALAAQATADMDRAVALAPDNIAVRVPRAAGLLPFARSMRPFNRPEADRLTRTAIGDFEFVWPPARLGGASWASMAAANCWALWPTAGWRWARPPRPMPISTA